MGRKLDGIVDGFRIGFISEDKLRGNMRSRYYTLLETNSEYRNGFSIGYGSAVISVLFGGAIGLGIAVGIPLIELANYLSK